MRRRTVVLQIVCTLALFTTGGYLVQAQDPLFSQFYYSPLYLNPAFTGCGKNDFRTNFSSRLQWVNLQSPLQSYSASADYFIDGPNAGIGVMMNRFNEGYLRTTQAYLLLAKSFGAKAGDCRTWFANVAFQGGFARNSANRNKFLFPDQIDVNGPTGQASEFELFRFADKPYFDMSVGMVFCFYNVMAGAAWQHVTEPVYGLIGGLDDSRLPRRYTFHLSYINRLLGDDNTGDRLLFKPSIIYNKQGVSNSLMMGGQFEIPEWTLGISAWYRNNFGSANSFGATENHTFSIGIILKLGPVKNSFNGDPDTRFNAGFNYEFELNQPGIRYTKGSMEAGMLYERNISSSNICPKGDECEVRYPWMFF